MARPNTLYKVHRYNETLKGWTEWYRSHSIADAYQCHHDLLEMGVKAVITSVYLPVAENNEADDIETILGCKGVLKDE